MLNLAWGALLGAFWQWRSRRPVLERAKAVGQVFLAVVAFSVCLDLLVLIGGGELGDADSPSATRVASLIGIALGLTATEAYLRRRSDLVVQ
ncbi:hypothetical protein [Nocardioides sp.]|uniref:hypothetical protein n=1 Tax=Nocardioides sp. TaxID=35761 RepID=UPI002618B0DD|nr:hypothetical protein [Nocardioides sp.]